MATAVILLNNGIVQQCDIFTGSEASQNYNSVGCIVSILHHLGYSGKHDIELDDIEDTDTSTLEVQEEYTRLLEGTGYSISWLDDVAVNGSQSYHKDPQFK